MEQVFYIEKLGIADVEAYKAMHLEALQSDPGMFGRSYEEERQLRRNGSAG